MQKVLTIAHQKGGVGKSTIALNLAVELSKHYPTTIIDLDYQKSLTIFNETRKEIGLPSLNIQTASTKEELINTIESNEGLVLIDSGGFDSDLNRLALLGSDLIITPLSNNLIEIYGLEAFKKILQELSSIKKLQAYVLLNNIHPQTKKALEELKEYTRQNEEYFQLLSSIIRRRNDFVLSFESGKSVVEIDPTSKASQELKELFSNIEKILFQ